MYTIQKDIGEQ